MPRIKPGAAGCKASTLSIVQCSPPPPRFLLLFKNITKPKSTIKWNEGSYIAWINLVMSCFFTSTFGSRHLKYLIHQSRSQRSVLSVVRVPDVVDQLQRDLTLFREDRNRFRTDFRWISASGPRNIGLGSRSFRADRRWRCRCSSRCRWQGCRACSFKLKVFWHLYETV